MFRLIGPLLASLWLMMGCMFSARAQVSFGGLVDAEIRKGGSDSSPYVNQTPNNKWTVYTPYIRLFANGVISDRWYVSSTLQADYYNGERLSPLFFSTINANWFPFRNSDFQVTVGRFVTPYGAYENRVLSSDNPFVHLPLSHASGLPIDQKMGILPDTTSYESVTGLTMIYQRMYSQGIRVSNQVGDNQWLQYSLAATLAAASSYFEVGEHDVPAATGRIQVKPSIWSTLGLSFSMGPFMMHDPVNVQLSDSKLASYKQTMFGTDLTLTYHYYSILLAYNWSRWSAPYIAPARDVLEDQLKATANHLSVEGRVNFPFLVGSYAAARYEALLSGDIIDEEAGGYYSNETRTPWTYDRHRLEVTGGYKLQRNIILKLSYLYSTDDGPNLKDDVLALQWSLAF